MYRRLITVIALVGASGAALALVPRRAAQSRPVDLSARLRIEDGVCSFSPQIDRAVGGMMSFNGEGRPTARTVRLGGMSLRPRLTYHPQTDPNSANWNASAEATLPRPATWNGLRLRGLRALAEHEGSAEGIVLDAQPAAVQRVLRGQGINVPLPPDVLDLPVEACSASLYLERVGGRTALMCSSGC